MSAFIMTYQTAGRARIDSIEALRALLHPERPFYVYLLCHPPAAATVRPFYVGIGQGDRLFAHEREAEGSTSQSPKLSAIRQIRSQGREIVRYIDEFFDTVPWHREQELIDQFGLVKAGTGILTNEQRYSRSVLIDGVELRKYADDGNALPANFLKRDVRLVAGPKRPRNPASVYGKICDVLEANPGVTGAELVELLLAVDFSDNNTVYGVSRPWLAKYIDGGFYAKNLFIQEAQSKRIR